MTNKPPKFELRADMLLSVCAGLAAVVWMILIFAVGMTLPAYIAAAVFVVCAAASSLLRFRDTKDLPAEEKIPAPPLAFLRGTEAVERYCTGCGAPLRKSDKFCAKCGRKAD